MYEYVFRDSIVVFIFKNEAILLLLHKTNVTRAFERDLGMNIRIMAFEISTSTLVLPNFTVSPCISIHYI
jgi:hypothetical protein